MKNFDIKTSKLRFKQDKPKKILEVLFNLATNLTNLGNRLPKVQSTQHILDYLLFISRPIVDTTERISIFRLRTKISQKLEYANKNKVISSIKNNLCITTIFCHP